MKTFWGAALAAALAVAVPAGLGAQSTANPVTTAVRRAVAQHAKTMTAAAEEMPAEDYTFKPTPQQRSFGEVVLHVAQSNEFLCSKITGEAAPAKIVLTASSPKADLVKAIQDSFTYCDQALSKIDDSTLTQEVALFGPRKMTRAAALIDLSNDLADHYSQQAMYLRLKGHLPPTAQPRKTSGQ
ncbi:MAG TPA: DinB family protein [Vicinamibacterales bacterium]|jgi:uncharacterized damage-inducible protein DinB